jgi:Spy/CpxP family protein refolding chaperone
MKSTFARYTAGAILAAGLIFAQTPSTTNPAPGQHAGRQAFMQKRFDHMAQQLNLTDAQKAQAQTFYQQARQEAAPIRAQLKQNRQALFDAVKAGKSDADIRALAATTGNLTGQLVAIRTSTFAKVYSILTPEQRAKADQMHQQMKNRQWHRPGNRTTS